MSDSPQASEQPKNIQTATDRPNAGLIVGILLVAALIGLGFFLWQRSKNNKTVQAPADVNKIQQTFNLPTGSVEGAFTPPTPAGTAQPENQTAQPAQAAEPRGPITPQNAGQPTPPPNSPTATAQPWLYSNPTLGFQMTVPGNWQAKPRSNDEIDFFDKDSGREVGYVEVFDDLFNTTLDDIRQSLQNSPDVKSVNDLTFQGQPALQFLTNTQFQDGIAVINNTHIYYLRGELAKPGFSASFRFN